MTKLTMKETFTEIANLNGSSIFIDYQNKMVKVEWFGLVELETAKILLNKGADIIESGQCDKILLNRLDLIEFSTEARVWIKQDLLKSRAKKVVNNVKKVATVKSTSIMGSIVSNFINKSIKLVYPNLKISNFDNEDQAINWLIHITEIAK